MTKNNVSQSSRRNLNRKCHSNTKLTECVEDQFTYEIIVTGASQEMVEFKVLFKVASKTLY
jgi:hypothetical protein